MRRELLFFFGVLATGCAPDVVGTFCANDPGVPQEMVITIWHEDGQLKAHIEDAIMPLDSDCTLEPVKDTRRYVGSCSDAVLPSINSGITIDVVDEDTLHVDYVDPISSGWGGRGTGFLWAKRCSPE